MARRLTREPSGYPAVWGMLLAAALDARSDRLDDAATALREAIALADAREMRLCAAAARWRLGELLGGDEGDELIGQAGQWMSGEGVANTERLLAVVVPGFGPEE